MLKALTAVNTLLRTLVSLILVALLAAAGWLGVRTVQEFKEREVMEALLAQREAEIGRLTEDLAAKQRQIAKLETALRLLKVDHRIAQIDVLDQQGSAKAGNLVTTFSFVELDGQGKPLEEPKIFRVNGDVVYVDALVVKFADEAVEAADPLRSTSLCLFRRVFSEVQKPNEGFALDRVGSQPAVYRTGEKPSEFEQEIWSRFWELANNRAEAEKKGIRHIHGEAPFQKLAPGKRYKVSLRSSGGLSFVPEDVPPKSANQAF